MDKKKAWMYLEVIMLMVWVITLIIFLSVVFGKEVKCMSNPLIYGTKVLSEKNEADFSCVCSFDNAPNEKILANKDGWSYVEDNSIDLSGFEED